MLNFFQILRIIGVLLIVAFALLYILKNIESIGLLISGVVLVILSSFLIESINFRTHIEPFLKDAGFVKISQRPKISQINYDEMQLDYAFASADLSLYKLRLERVNERGEKQKNEQIFRGMLFIKDGVAAQDFSIKSAPIFQKSANKPCKLDNIDFNNYFHLYCSDTIAIYRLFSPSKLEIIAENAKKLGKKISLFYEDSRLYIYIHNFSFSKNIAEEFRAISRIIDEFSNL